MGQQSELDRTGQRQVLLAKLVGTDAIPSTCSAEPSVLRFEPVKDGLVVGAAGWHNLSISERLNVLREIVAMSLAHETVSALIWSFSGVQLDREGMRDTMNGWRSARFPILSLIDVVRVRDGAMTDGFQKISGFEIETRCRTDCAAEAKTVAVRAAADLLDGSTWTTSTVVKSGKCQAIVANLPSRSMPVLRLSLLKA